MRRFVIVALLCSFGVAVHGVPAAPASTALCDAANDAWQRGDHIAALTGHTQVLNAPGGDRFLDPIALTTGELFETRELTVDGRAPRFSPDGRFIVYETRAARWNCRLRTC